MPFVRSFREAASCQRQTLSFARYLKIYEIWLTGTGEGNISPATGKGEGSALLRRQPAERTGAMSGICVRCHQPVADGEVFCASCGQPTGAAQPRDAGMVSTVIGAAMPGARTAAGSWPTGHGDSVPGAAALGKAVADGAKLSYSEPEGSFDPIGNPKLLRQFAMHAILYFAVYVALAVAFGLLFAIFALIGLGLKALALWYVGAGLVGLLFLCLYWLIPVPAQLSEWKILVDGKASVAPMIFDHIAWTLQRRQTPLDDAKVRKLKLAGGEGRDYLEVRRGLFSGLVCCFAYGEDLYVGWTFWLRISPLRCLLMFLARLWQTLMRRGTDMYVTLRYDYAKAMREAIHNSAREGVDVAIGESRAQGQGTVSSMQVAVTDVAL